MGKSDPKNKNPHKQQSIVIIPADAPGVKVGRAMRVSPRRSVRRCPHVDPGLCWSRSFPPFRSSDGMTRLKVSEQPVIVIVGESSRPVAHVTTFCSLPPPLPRPSLSRLQDTARSREFHLGSALLASESSFSGLTRSKALIRSATPTSGSLCPTSLAVSVEDSSQSLARSSARCPVMHD